MPDTSDTVDGCRAAPPVEQFIALPRTTMAMLVRFAVCEQLDDVDRTADGERCELDVVAVAILESLSDLGDHLVVVYLAYNAENSH